MASKLLKIVSVVLLFTLVFSANTVDGLNRAVAMALWEPGSSSLYRVDVTLSSPAARERLNGWGIVTLSEGESWAQLVVSEAQLQKLAQLNYHPRHASELGELVVGNAVSRQWLLKAFQPVLLQAETVLRQPEVENDQSAAGLEQLLSSLSVEQRAALSPLADPDDDNDGLSNTEETWWCTNPNNPDSDSDTVKDGQEITQLLAGNRTNGKPFLGWPASIPGCYDDDYDSVPDLTETNVIGLSINRESTDLDKYDDGQEFFGSTYCPGGPGNCGYGALPRTEDLYLGSNMPSFVQAPANSPFVAAFPDPSVSIVDGSLNVQSVTTVTTDHTITNGESHYYETTTTNGTSTSTYDLQTWNDWQAVGITTTTSGGSSSAIGNLDTWEDLNDRQLQNIRLPGPTIKAGSTPQGLTSWLKIGGGTMTIIGAGIAIGCILTAGAVCVGAAAVAVAGFAATGTILTTSATVIEKLDEEGVFDAPPDYANDAMHPGKCSTSSPGNYTCIPDDVYEQQNNQNIIDLGIGYTQYQDLPSTETDTNYSEKPDGHIEGEKSHSGEIPLQQVDLSKLEPVRRSTEKGGTKGTVTAEYSETSITDGQEFSSSESWSEATAVNSAHAADLRFTFRVSNEGTDILRVMDGLIFNVYLGADPNPIYSYNVIAQTGVLSNLQPDQQVTFTANPIPLTLQQMAKIDQGNQLFIMVEHLSYGGDQVFFQDAINGGLIVGIEDGWQDGDDTLDLYVMPCFGSPCGVDPNESIQTILQRGFPTREDDSGNLLTISTPEVNGTQATWVEHSLAYNSWWNAYFSANIQYTGAISTTRPLAGESVVVRILTDTDLDGFNDRTEERLGTAPNDAASHPNPELIAGALTERSGNNAVVKMAFLNTGAYDAAGVEVVAYAPNDSITLVDNVIGGSGRVGAGNRVILGGRIRKSEMGSGWSSTATPKVGGQYIGLATKIYYFTATNNGTVGSGSLIINWSDGTNSGQLQFGAGYLSPSPLAVGSDGVLLGFNTGSLIAGNNFTVQVSSAGDTIRYTINHEPYTPPVLVVSYNDPQGNHRFIAPVIISSLNEDLATYSGQMIPDLELSITTPAPFDASASNTTYYITNSPDDHSITNAHLFIEFINGSGQVVAEQVFTRDLIPGPTIWPVTWDTSTFSETFTTADDYTLLAYWADSQGNIIDTAVRPLASFQEDPLPQVEATSQAWDFGQVYQGDLVYREFVAANVGYDRLPVMGLTGNLTGKLLDSYRASLWPVESLATGLLLDTSSLGPVSGNLTFRAGDLDTPEIVIPVTGEILASPNLIINDDDVTFSYSEPGIGQTITLFATVHNTSTHPVENVVVRFFQNDPLNGGTQIGSEQIISMLAAGGQGTVSISWTYSQGQNLIHVRVDPENVIPETDEWDNDARNFLHTDSLLPTNGILSNQHVYLVTDVSQITNPNIQVIDGATLIFQSLTTTLNSLLVGDNAIVIFDNTNIQLTTLSYNTTISSTYFAAENQSVISVSQPFTITAHRIELIGSKLSSTGASGASGASGLPAGISLSGDVIAARYTNLNTTGGSGGNGLASSTNGGGGGNGGNTWLSLSAKDFIQLQNINFNIQAGSGGAGGNGGGDPGEYGGNGGSGGIANFSAIATSLAVLSSSVIVRGGSGGIGGYGQWGGHGGAGSPAKVNLSGNAINIISSVINPLGGNGGNGGESQEETGGNGGSGGKVNLDVNGINTKFIAADLLLSGGIGGLGGLSGDDGGSGSSGGNSLVSIISTDLQLAYSKLSVMSGDGGNGGLGVGGDGNGRGGSGGSGGQSTQIIEVTKLEMDSTSIQMLGGMAGMGASGRTLGGNGGYGGEVTLAITATNLAANISPLELLAQDGGTGGSAFGDNSSKHNRGGNGGTGGSTIFHLADSFATTPVISATMISGDGGNGGNAGNAGYDFTGGNAGSGGNLEVTAATSMSWGSHLGLWNLTIGMAGLIGGGTIPGQPGSDGIQSFILADGYEAASPGMTSVQLGTLTPNLLTLKDVITATLAWDNGESIVVAPPYITSVPRASGFHNLHILYDYVDGTQGESQHDFYVYEPSQDTDSDGLLNGTEINLYHTDLLVADTDQDGLDDGDEITAKTDPLNSDSDYDGILDGVDPEVLYDPDVTAATPVFSDYSPTEGATITLSSLVSNIGSNSAEGIVVAFFDGDPATGGMYACADFITSLDEDGSALAQCTWDTTGITGTHSVYVWVDPLDRIVEENAGNNKVHASLYVREKADLFIASISTPSSEVRLGEQVETSILVKNLGETDAGAATLALYQGTVLTGTQVMTASVTIPAGEQQTVPLNWIASELGPALLSAWVDTGNIVVEMWEENNKAQSSLYVGWGPPVYIDAAGASDPAYAALPGYGYLTPGTTVTSCGSLPHQTYRQRNSGEQMQYRFDYLLPGHFYHLDMSFFLCSGSRILRVLVDGVEVANPVTADNLGTSLSLWLDPSMYADHSIVITIEKIGGGLGGPVVSEIKLADIRYCYRDSGLPNEVAYAGAPDGCGWLDGSPDQSWGTLPYQSVRYDEGSSVQYRFDQLEAAKKYQLNQSFYENDSTGRIQSILVDGIAVMNNIQLSSTIQNLAIEIPSSTYSDGSVIVEIIDGTSSQPVISEISIEEITKLIIPPSTFSISGQVVDNGGSPISGVTISDGAGHLTSTDSNGDYTLTGLPPATYTLTASKSDYNFSPTSQQVTLPPSATNINFIGTLITYSISGQATNSSADPIEGVTISDGAGHSAITDENGNYTLSDLLPATYTLSASKSGYTFSPGSQQVTLPPSATNVNFTGTLITYSISGRVEDDDGNPIHSVTISDGAGHSTSTDSNGDYTLSGLPPTTYILTASKSGYGFSPSAQQVTLPPSATNVDFTGSMITYSINGRVVDGIGNPIQGVTISDGAGYSTSTDSNGDYSLNGLLPATYILTASKSGYGFSPSAQQVTLPPSATNVDFTGSMITYSINGRVVDGIGNPIQGVTISDGAGHSTSTDSNGDYSLNGLPPATYTLTASKSGYNFSPSSQQVSLPPSATSIDFTGTLIAYSISGQVVDDNGNPIQGVTISDGAGHSTITDENGYYTINGLLPSTYILTPSKEGFTFLPKNQEIILTADVNNRNFTGTFYYYIYLPILIK